MKVLFRKFKNPKILLLHVFTVALLLLAPVSFGRVDENKITLNESSAATESVSAILNSHTADVLWVTPSKLAELLKTGEWTKVPTPDQTVDTSNIIGGVVKEGVLTYAGGSAGGWIISLAEKIAAFIIKSILAVVYLVLWVAYSIFYGLVLLSEKMLEMVLDPVFASKDGYLGGFTAKAFVKSTAQLLANLCNMLYIFVLIYIAIKAMFGSSNTRNLLVKLVIAALLTNFGLVLAGVVIDFAQVIMYTVWDGIKGSSGSFAPGSKILDQLQESLGAGRAISQIDSFFGEALKFLTMSITQIITEIIKIAGLIVMSLALVVTLISLTLILMIRIFALWILLILTPVAFLFSILPQTEKYWNQWLENLTKYAFTGPILIFFLWLALKLSATLNRGNVGADRSNALAGLGNVGNIQSSGDLKYIFYDFVAQNISIIFEMSVVVVTIWGGILIANKFGIKGAKNLDALIGYTKQLGFGALAAIGYAGKGIKMGTWSGMNIREGFRNRKLERMRHETAALKASGKIEQATTKEEEVKNLEERIKNSREQKETIMKGLGILTPSLMKKRFSTYLKQRGEEYQGDLNKAFSGFTNYILNYRQKKYIAGENVKENLYDYQTELNKLISDWDKSEDDPEKRDIVGEKIKLLIEGMVKKMTDDPDKQKQLLNRLMTDNFDLEKDTNRNLIKDSNGNIIYKINSINIDRTKPNEIINNFGQKLGIDIVMEASDQAKKEATDFLKGDKIREEEAKKLHEAIEDIRKEGDKFNPDNAIRMIIRGSVDKIKQKALIEYLATSSRNFGKLIEGINKERGNEDVNNMGNAIEYLKDRFSEFDMLNFLRIAEKDADKTSNLSQMGWMTFDPILNKARLTEPIEREDILKKIIPGWSLPRKIAKVHPQVIDSYDSGSHRGELKDSSAAKVLLNSIDWNYVNNSPKLLADIQEDISDRNRELLAKISEKQDDEIINQRIMNAQQVRAFKDVVRRLKEGIENTNNTVSTPPPSTPPIVPEPSRIIRPYDTNARGKPISRQTF